MKYFFDFISLVYPRICLACGASLRGMEKTICTSCLYHLPRTHFHEDPDNPVKKVFWGRVNVENATACFFFTKKGKTQQLLHALKYRGKKEVGIYIGMLYGMELRESVLWGNIDVIIPVPLHPVKKKKRGYNQSEQFARGLGSSMGIKVDTSSLHRQVASQTQTRKSRFNRWKNVENIFKVRKWEDLQNKHVLLVDDVITTGATAEACIQALSVVKGIKISVAAIAFAWN